MSVLERRLGLPSIIGISIGAMLGSGAFVLPGLVISQAGSSAWLAYVLASIAVLPSALSKSELATAMPTSGGTYVYLDRSFGPLVGTIAGLGLWFSLLLKSSFALMGIAAYLSVFSFSLHSIALAVLMVIFLLNIWGVGKVSRVLNTVVFLSIVSLLLLLGWAQTELPVMRISEFTTPGFVGIISASALAYGSYAGVTKIAAVAEEIKNPEKNIPKGILFSLLIVTAIYALIAYTLTEFISFNELDGNLRSIYSLALLSEHKYMAYFFILIAFLSMASMANAGVLASSRFPFAMGRESLLPSFLGYLSPTFLTPIWSIVTSCLLIAFAIFYLDVYGMVKLASAFMIIIYCLENLAVMVLRESRAQWYKPSYYSPFYPFFQLCGIGGGLVFLAFLGLKIVFVATTVVAILGLTTFLLFGRHRTQRRGLVALRGSKASSENQDANTASEVEEEKPVFQRPYSTLVVLFGNERSSETLVEMGMMLAGKGNPVAVAFIIEIPEQTDVKDMSSATNDIISLRRRIRAFGELKNHSVSFAPIFSHDIYESIHSISDSVECQWIVMSWNGFSLGKFTIHDSVGWLRDHLSCNLIVFKDEGIRSFSRVAVLLSQSEDDILNLHTADHICSTFNGRMDLILYIPEELESSKKKEAFMYGETLSEKCSVKPHILMLEGKDHLGTIADITTKYDLLVLTSPPAKGFLEKLTGSAFDHIIERAECSVLSRQQKRTP